MKELSFIGIARERSAPGLLVIGESLRKFRKIA